MGLRFPRNKLQAYFVADGNPSDTLPINVNNTHKLESYVTPRVSLFFNLGPVTAGLTEGVSRVRGQSYATLGNFGEAALRMRVEFNGSNGVLLETGAGIGTTARGAAIYA